MNARNRTLKTTLQHRTLLPLAVALAALALTATPANAAIGIVNQTRGFADSTKSKVATTHLGATLLSYNATGVKKLVVAVGAEAGFNGQWSDITGVSFNGKALRQVIQENTGVGSAEIWYLDNPDQLAGNFTYTSTSGGGGLNGAFFSIIGLSGTVDGAGGIGDTNAVHYLNVASGTPIISTILTTAANSLVIALVVNNGINGGANSSGTPTVVSPLTLSTNGSFGSQWVGAALGYQFVATGGTTITPTFTTLNDGTYRIHTVAAEFKPASMTPPVIAQEPQSQTNLQWQATTFSVTLSQGTGPLSYQWYFSNAVEGAAFASLPGATRAMLSLPITDTTNAGGYQVVIGNAGGSTTSSVAMLTVTADTTGPSIVSVGSLNGWDVGIVLDKPISASHLDLSTFNVKVGTESNGP